MSKMGNIILKLESHRFIPSPESATDKFQKLMGTKWDQDGNFSIMHKLYHIDVRDARSSPAGGGIFDMSR